MAFKRRSLALTLIAIGFAAQWIPWARIDRAAFQYHYYTALPFVVLALAYFIAELWHGASRHTWALARVAAALAIIGPAAAVAVPPAAVRLRRRRVGQPGLAGLPGGHPGLRPDRADGGARDRRRASACCSSSARFLAFESRDGHETGRAQLTAAFRSLLVDGLGVVVGLLIAALLPDTAILTLTNIPVEPIALVVGIPLGYLALQVVGLARRASVRRRVRRRRRRLVRDPLSEHHRAAAAVGGRHRLPGHPADLPVRVPVPGEHRRRATRTRRCSRRCSRSCCSALTVTCLVVAYSAWAWRLALADEAGDRRLRDVVRATPDGLARTGGA